MITLKTLPLATPQMVYDQVKAHLLAQNERAASPSGACKYRRGTLACAAGCLVGDEEYTEVLEGSVWCELVELEVVPRDHSNLIVDLQKIHDYHHPSVWSSKLEEVAVSYGLNP